MLLEAQEAGIKVVTLNSGIYDEDLQLIGAPRDRFENWLLHSQADDRKAGYDLTELIVTMAREKFDLADDEMVTVSAIGGGRDTGASSLRRDGLYDYLGRGDARTSVNQFIYTDWSYEYGRSVAKTLLRRYGKPHVIWTAYTPLARAALDVWNETYLDKPLPVIGTIGWGEEVIELVEQEELAVVLGGHFMEGAWLLTLVYDHYNGIDFEDEIGLEMRVTLSKVDAANVRPFKTRFGDRDWQKIEFKHFSKCHTASIM